MDGPPEIQDGLAIEDVRLFRLLSGDGPHDQLWFTAAVNAAAMQAATIYHYCPVNDSVTGGN